MRDTIYEFTVNFRAGDGSSDLPGVLDMMRYDGARVVKWDTDTLASGRRWSVTLRTDRYPTVDRWLTFGLRPVNITERN